MSTETKNQQQILDSLREPLKKEDIEIRMSTQAKSFFSFLLYKTARVDEKRLSESGLIWENEFIYSNNGDLVCKIKYFDDRINQWVTRMDTGTDGANAFGQANKGLFSDSFKRAGFKFGIGAELYTMSNIDTQVWCNMQQYQDNKGKTRFNLPSSIQYEKLFVSEYEVIDGQIVTVEISCSKGAIYRFKDGKKWTNTELLNQGKSQPKKQAPARQPRPTEDDINILSAIIKKRTPIDLNGVLIEESATLEQLKADWTLYDKIMNNLKG